MPNIVMVSYEKIKMMDQVRSKYKMAITVAILY